MNRLLFVLLLAPAFCHGQQSKIDSLKNAISLLELQRDKIQSDLSRLNNELSNALAKEKHGFIVQHRNKPLNPDPTGVVLDRGESYIPGLGVVSTTSIRMAIRLTSKRKSSR